MARSPRSIVPEAKTPSPFEGATTPDVPAATGSRSKKAAGTTRTATTRKAAAPKKTPSVRRARKKEEAVVAGLLGGGAPETLVDLTAGRGTKAQPAARAAATTYDPTLDEIAERAYQIYQRRGAVHGRDIDDWLEAERQLREEHESTY